MTLPNLGLVCLTTSEEIRFKALTRTRFLAMAPEQQISALRALYSENAHRLAKAIDYCAARKIRLYRVSSTLFPFAEESPGFDLLEEMRALLQRTGREAQRLGIRLVSHPDQFVVLSKDGREVIDNSIRILEHQARVFDLLDQPRTPWAAMQLHGGKGGGRKSG